MGRKSNYWTDLEELRPPVWGVSLVSPEKARRLKAIWSLEAAQDLHSIHNIDTAWVLADTLRDEIQKGVTYIDLTFTI